MQENLKANFAIPKSLLFAHRTLLDMAMQLFSGMVAAALVGAVFCDRIHGVALPQDSQQ